MDLYPYTHGDAFAEKRRYNYAPYAGRPFLQAWCQARQELLRVDTSPSQDEACLEPSSTTGEDALDQLAQAWRRGAGAAEWKALRRLIQHFEVGQRIYGRYGPGFVPQDRSDFRSLDRYLLAAELFESAYARSLTLDALNALLKALDLLSTQAQTMSVSQRARLGRLAQCETHHVRQLAQSLEVTW